jgi:hypothetical protein
MKYGVYIIILLLISLLELFVSSLLEPERLADDRYRLSDSYNINPKDKDFFSLERVNYVTDDVHFGECTEAITKSVKIQFSYFEVLLPDDATLLINKGSIINDGGEIYSLNGNAFLSEHSARRVGVTEEDDGTYLKFENIGDLTIRYSIRFDKPFSLKNYNFYYKIYYQNIKPLKIKNAFYSLENGYYTFELSGIEVNKFIFNNSELEVTMEMMNDFKSLFIHKSFLEFDENTGKYFVKKQYYSSINGHGYKVVYLDQVTFIGQYALIQGAINEGNICVKII